jgi:dephospho-CoA kinase
MKVLGLTGGVGMGKSATAQLFRLRSVPVVDTDDLARAVVEPNQPALGEIRTRFGEEVIDFNGKLDRSKLARIIFSDEAARKQLEKILHPRIRDLWKEQIKMWRAQGQSLALVVIPLLFETGAETEMDATICVACSEATQLKRLSARNWSLEQIQQRLKAQWPVEKKLTKADYVIWTEGSLEITALQLDRILQTVETRSADIPVRSNVRSETMHDKR